MKASIDTVERFAYASLALMDHEVSDEERNSFHEDLGRHFKAMEIIAEDRSNCRLVGIWIQCPHPRALYRVSPTFTPAGEEKAPSIAQLQSGHGPLVGGGYCMTLPGGCELCYRFECD